MLVLVFTGLLGLISPVYSNVIIYTQDIPHLIQEEFLDVPASFGDDLPPEGLRGFLVEAVPADGCSALDKPPTVDNFTGKWIVLIARFNCSFETKIRNAQAAGFDCAIVHNVNSSDLEKMSAKDPDGITIPSVFVSEVAGIVLAGDYIYTKGYYIMVNGDLPFNINTHLLLPFAIVVVLCLLVILIFMIVKCIKDRRRARRHRLPHRSLQKIPTCKFSKGDPYETCAICLDDYQEGDKLRVLPCAHAYHSACIDPWLTRSRRVCPVCKRRVLAAGERTRTHSDSHSDSDTEPLLHNDEQQPPTEGGTFEPQRVNPFVRANRLMRRLYQARQREATTNGDDPEVPAAAATAESDQSNENNAETSNSDEQPLLASAGVTSERRRDRRARRALARTHARDAHAHAHPHAHPREHSINGGEHEHGEIGVAALPAQGSPRHLNL